MRRLALLGATFIALATAAAACSDTPLQPRELAGSRLAPSFATSSTSLVCENAVYPVSLCYPFDLDGKTPLRPKLCAALNNGTGAYPFKHPVVGRPATEAFEVVGSDSKETVTIPRPYLPNQPQVLTFYITRAQITQICS